MTRVEISVSGEGTGLGRHMMNLFMWTLRFNQTSPCQSWMKAESGGWRLGRWAGMAGRD